MSVLGRPLPVRGIGRAGGNPATFPDGDGSPLRSCVVTMEPIQAGTGDPAPDNVRPISGRTAATVTANGTSVTVQLGRTVYGGTLDVATGLLTIDTEYYEPNGSSSGEDWSEHGTGSNRYFQVPLSNQNFQSGNQISSHFAKVPVISITNAVIGFSCGYSTSREAYCFAVRPPNIASCSLQSWKNWLSDQYAEGSPVQVCYKITPVTIRLTPARVQTVLGANAVLSPDGGVAAVYNKKSMLTMS